MPTTKQDADILYRLTNLTFTLLDSPTPRDHQWLLANVDGYRKVSSKTLQRDLNELRRIGVPVVADAQGVSVSREDYELTSIDFTPEEATAVGMAGDLGRNGALGTFARSGWTKLAAAGAERDLEFASRYVAYDDSTSLSPEFLRLIENAVVRRRVVTFTYKPTPDSEGIRRCMEPWGLVANGGRVYLTGFDRERREPRSFRAIRVQGIALTTDKAMETPPDDLQGVVRDSMTGMRPRTDATLRIEEGHGGPFGVQESGTVVLSDVDRDWLIRTAAAAGPGVVVVAPEDVRQDVITLLKAALS